MRSKSLWIVALALAVRFSYLAYNISCHIPDEWGGQARACMYYAQVLSKTPIAASLHDLTFEDARLIYVYDDNGLVFIHYLIAKVFGHTSFLRLQILQLLLDALLVFPIMGIGKSIGGKRAGYWAGIAYALFIPEIWLATSPGYDFWATLGLVAATGLYLKAYQLLCDKRPYYLFCFALGTLIVTLAGIVRSTVIYYPFVFIAAFFLIGKISWRQKSMVGLMVVGTWFLAFSPKLLQNYNTYGHVRVVRNTLGHNFWLGVGKFPNPYGITPTDDGIQYFYRQLSGRQETFGAMYEQVLMAKAHEYVRTHPLHYAWTVSRRFESILSGLSMRCAGMIANVYVNDPTGGIDYAEAHERGAEHSLLIQHHGEILGNAFYLLKNPGRLAFLWLLLLPLGLLLSWIWEQSCALGLALAPMIYTLITLSPFDFTGRNDINAYAAVLPVCVLGYLKLYDRFFKNSYVDKFSNAATHK